MKRTRVSFWSSSFVVGRSGSSGLAFGPRSGSRGLFGSSPYTCLRGTSLLDTPRGPEPGINDCRLYCRPSANDPGMPPVNGSSYSGNTQSVYSLNSQYEWQSLCCVQL